LGARPRDCTLHGPVFAFLQDALAKLAVARSALEAEQTAAKAQSKQLTELQQQLSGMKDTLATVTQDKAALSTLTEQISERDGKIEVCDGVCVLVNSSACIIAVQHVDGLYTTRDS
jgi:hypothetical protein